PPERGVTVLFGLRTPHARHIEDRVTKTAERERAHGEKIPLCGVYLPAGTTRSPIEQIAPAVVCPYCVARARVWYADFYFVPFDSVQRRRLLDALSWDLEHV
ncbi:MAG: hypothetical protein ACRDPE_02225, partial [Solirubrobacterales bacterium]